MRGEIKPSALHGTVTAPPSKSMAHRLLICAGLSEGESVVRRLAFSQDVKATIDCLRALGAEIRLDGDTAFVKGTDVRKAIGMAINVDEIITSIYSGNAIRENGIIPTGIWGHNDSLAGFPYDPEGAQKLLTDAGYVKGQIYFELSMDSSANSDTQLLYQNISQELGKIGINAEVKTYDHSSWLALRSSGRMNSFVARWGMDYNDPSNIMYSFFGSEENTRNRSINYPDKETIKRVAAAPAIVNDEERMAEYQALEKKIIGEDAAWIPLFEELHLYCMGERVQSFVPHWAGFSDFYAIDVTLK